MFCIRCIWFLLQKNQNADEVENNSEEQKEGLSKEMRKEVGVKVGNVARCAMTKQGQELFKLVGRKYIKLNTCERVLKDQLVLTTILKGVRGDCVKGISEHNIAHLMKYHLKSDY